MLILVSGSCEKEELEFVDEQTVQDNEEAPGNKMKENGKKLKNPYSVKNMKKAFAKVKGKNGNKVEGSEQYIIIDDDYTIETSHHYLKFEPRTEEEVYEMKKDSSLVLFDYPLDVEFTDTYLDSRTSSDPDAIPNYYTAVPVEEQPTTTLRPILLEELYIPEEDPYFDGEMRAEGKAPKADKEELMRRLLKEAFILTENEEELSNDKNGSKGNNETKALFGTKWTPSGNIQIWDNTFSGTQRVQKFSHYEYYPCYDETIIQDPSQPAEITPIDGGGSGTCQRAVYKYVDEPTDGKYVPLQGAQVLMRQWFTIRQGITDSKGNFSTRSLRGNARYIIQWERYQYSIRNGSIFQAETRGPRVKEQAWNKKIKGGDDEYHGIIHTAAHDYYYGHRFGFTSPPVNFFTGRQLKIAAREINGGSTGSSYSHIKNDLSLGIAAQIHIKAWGRSSERVYGTTIHELAHAAHSVVDRTSYDNVVRDAWIIPWQGGAVVNNNRRLLETWARTVEVTFTNERYRKKFGLTNFNYRNSLQFQTISEEIHYTSGGLDMIDNINQRQEPNIGNGSLLFPIDRVEGYNIRQLENALVGAKSWWQWRDNVKNKYFNSTEKYLDELFNNWPN